MSFREAAPLPRPDIDQRHDVLANGVVSAKGQPEVYILLKGRGLTGVREWFYLIGPQRTHPTLRRTSLRSTSVFGTGVFGFLLHERLKISTSDTDRPPTQYHLPQFCLILAASKVEAVPANRFGATQSSVV